VSSSLNLLTIDEPVLRRRAWYTLYTSMLNYPMRLGLYGTGLGGLGMMGLGGMGLGMMGMGMGMGYPYGMMMQNPYGYSGMVSPLLAYSR